MLIAHEKSVVIGDNDIAFPLVQQCLNSWAGHYAFNAFDQNAILGPHTTVENFIFVNGFSGHGLQQSPAMGRGISELLTYGEYRTLDLTAFDYQRIEQQRPFNEKAII